MATVSGSSGVSRHGAGQNGVAHNGSRREHPSTGVVPGGDIESDAVWMSAGPWPEPEPDEFEIERQRLEAAIAAAKARLAAARRRSADRDVGLRSELVASQERVAEMEREHAAAIAEIRETAQAEVTRILAAARRQVAGVTAAPTAPATAEVHDAE